MSNKLSIFFGTETGNSETVAQEISDELNELGIENELTDLSESSVADLSSVQKSLFVVSTWGEGEPPAMMEDFFYDLENGKAGELPNLEYAIVALGDTGYDEFCGCGRKIDEYLLKAGAKNYMDRLELDSYYDEEVAEWKTRFYPKIKEMWGLAESS
jgi:sulfite reductase (NADPH) flavoprotein alpha-component